MHLISTFFDGSYRVGYRSRDYIFLIDKAYNHCCGREAPQYLHNMRSLLWESEESFPMLEKINKEIKKILVESDGYDVLIEEGVIRPISDIEIGPPVPNPGKIICIGQNYRDHCEEQNKPIPKNPILFSKFNNAIIGPDKDIIKPRITDKLDFEGELAFVMGKHCKNVSSHKAMDCIAGYTIFHDVSARDIQFGDRQWLRGKSFDTFAPMGPYLITADEVPDPHDLDIVTRVNDQIMQDSNTSNLIFNIPYLIEFITRAIPLEPGDIVATGTPAGVGVFRNPPVFLKPGDVVTIEIENLGVLQNRVVQEHI